MNDGLLVLDTETGGLDLNRFSILSLGGVIWRRAYGVRPLLATFL